MVYVDEAGIDNREDYGYGYCEVGKRFHALRCGKRTERVSWISVPDKKLEKVMKVGFYQNYDTHQKPYASI
jgi:hypothetical protein